MDLRSAVTSTFLLALVLWMPLPAIASSKLYIVYMGEKKHDDPSVVTASHHDVLTSILGSKDEALKSIVYSYKHGFSGFAAMLTESQAEELSTFPEVLYVKPDTHYETQTTRSWDFLGLNNDQPSGLLQRAKQGEDIIVGVVDSGIWPEPRSFDDSGYGPVPARWRGACQTGAAFNATGCNKKIIGVRWYTGGVEAEALQAGEFMSARDMGGHGTHVASTIASSPVRNASFGGGLAAGVARGGAPRARLAVYKACWGPRTRCGGAAILAAIDDATNDGVDVLSLSLGGFQEFAGTLHAVARGIPVVFSGMNDGPAPQTVRNTAPWVVTVAATMMDRSFPTVMQLGNNERLVGQSHYFDAAANTSEFRMLVSGRRCDNTALLASLNASGNVVLCYEPADTAFNPPRQRLGEAIDNVQSVGAKGIIFAGYSSNVVDNTDRCGGVMPCVLVDYETANRIAVYMARTRTPVVRISPAKSVVGDTVLSPRVASFSARGPSAEFPGILKPDIGAPGVSILAAVRDSYQFMSGTSMACPHVSAIIALLKSIHPDWSPALIKSAIITTASMTDGFGMPIQAEGVPRKLADPFDIGGGHIDPDRAADPGLVYDIDPSEYTKFFTCTLRPRDDCQSFMGKLYQLNLPSISVPDLKSSVTVSRTVTNVGPAEATTYRVAVEAPAGVDVSVEPEELTFAVDGSRNATFTVTFTARRMVQGVYTFGSLEWSDGGEHSVRIPIAVRTVTEEFVADVS